MPQTKTQTVLRVARYVLNWPLWIASRRTRRDPRLWVFGAWNGERFSGNSRALAIRANNESDLRVVWLATNKAALAQARDAGLEAVSTYSFKGYKLSMSAGLGVVSTSHRDINQFTPPLILLNLWHGIPLKRIGWDAPSLQSALDRAVRFSRAFPFHAPDLSRHMAASSAREADQLASAFRLSRERVHIIGQARNDSLGPRAVTARQRQVLYVPTFRQGGTFDPVDSFIAGAPIIERYCVEHNLEFHALWHPNLDPRRGSEALTGLRRVSVISPDQTTGELNDLLDQIDVLVTDYSSTYIDFLLTQRPMIFAAFDLDEYSDSDRGFYFDYLDPMVTPGPKCKDWDSIMQSVIQLIEDPQYFAAERRAARDMFHSENDGGATQRALDLARVLAIG